MRNESALDAGLSVPPRVVAARRARRFYVGMAIAIALTVFAGFSRTYFLKAYYGTPELSTLLHIHGVVFTTWVLFLVAQTSLVATGRTYIHRRMGVAGAVLALLVFVMGSLTAILRVKGGSPRFPAYRAFPSSPYRCSTWLCSLAGGQCTLLPPQARDPQAADAPRHHRAVGRPDRPISSRGALGLFWFVRPLHCGDGKVRPDHSQEGSSRHALGRPGACGVAAAAADDLGDAGVAGFCRVA